MKKGQISIFIIIGLLIIIILGIIVWSSNKQKVNEVQSNNNIELLQYKAEVITNYVEQCINEISVKGIYLVGLQGGYLDPEPNPKYGTNDNINYQMSGFVKIPYWYHNEEDISPNIDKVEEDLGKYILFESKNCKDFGNFESTLGVDIFKSKDEKINVSINDEDISITLFKPIKLKSLDGKKNKCIPCRGSYSTWK